MLTLTAFKCWKMGLKDKKNNNSAIVIILITNFKLQMEKHKTT